MMDKKQIAIEYRDAKIARDRWAAVAEKYKALYEVRTTMETVADKYSDYFWCTCPERKGREVPLTFCIEKCTLKCPEWKSVQKHSPKLLAFVEKLNGRFFKLLNEIKELKRD
jgi:hypothetical protein